MDDKPELKEILVRHSGSGDKYSVGLESFP